MAGTLPRGRVSTLTALIVATLAFSAALAFGARSAEASTYAYGNSTGCCNLGGAVFVQAYVTRVGNLTTVHCDAEANLGIHINLTCGRLSSGGTGGYTQVTYVNNDPNLIVCWSATALFPNPNRYQSTDGCTQVQV